MYKTREEFQEAAKLLMELAEQHERGEISTDKLLTAWKEFYRLGSEYLEHLNRTADSNPRWN